MGRVGEPQDVANAVVFLTSPQSGWITAHTLTMDGGGWTTSHTVRIERRLPALRSTSFERTSLLRRPNNLIMGRFKPFEATFANCPTGESHAGKHERHAAGSRSRKAGLG